MCTFPGIWCPFCSVCKQIPFPVLRQRFACHLLQLAIAGQQKEFNMKKETCPGVKSQATIQGNLLHETKLKMELGLDLTESMDEPLLSSSP